MSTPTRNHVERSPSFVRTTSPGTTTSPFVLVRMRSSTRSEGLSVTRTSSSLPGTLNVEVSFAAVNANGPQVWCGEAVSYGSGTPTRYGTASPRAQTSSIDAVRPPDVEKKNVVATLPSNSSTWPAVASTAAFVVGFSAATPPYTWLRVSA